MKLADVIDLELQLAADEALDDGALRDRDRALYRALSPAPEAPGALLAAWLGSLRAQGLGAHWSAPLMRAHRLLRVSLVAVGLLLGSGLAEALLHYEEGGPPVNVGHYLAVVVLGQLGLLTLLLVAWALRSLWPSLLPLSEVGRTLRFCAEWLAARLSTSAHEDAQAWLIRMRRLRGQLGLYRPLEQAWLLGESQLFGVAFNLGLLFSCARLVLLSDLAFGWSTSVTALDPPTVHSWVGALATPFSPLLPTAVPSLELVEATQYFRLDGRFSGSEGLSRGDARLSSAWWSFVLACTVTYGLLPRLLLLGLARVALVRAERRVPLDTPAVARVLRRLTTPELRTRAEVAFEDAAPAARARVAESATQAQDCVLLLYRDVPTRAELIQAAVTEQLGLSIRHVFPAGGFSAAQDEAVLQQLAAAPTSVVLVTEAWEAPDKGLRTLLARLRECLGPRRALWVSLLGEAHSEGFSAPRADDVALFRDRLTLLEDPYLCVEALPARAEVGR